MMEALREDDGHAGTEREDATDDFGYGIEDPPAPQFGSFVAADVAYSPDGSFIAVACGDDHVVRQVDVLNNGAISTLAGTGNYGHIDGAADTAKFNSPTGVVYSPDGLRVAVADKDNHQVREITVAAGAVVTVTTLAGTGTQGVTDGAGLGATQGDFS